MKPPRRTPRSRGGARFSASEVGGDLMGKLNLQTLAALAVLVFGIFTLAPMVQLFFEQRQAIADLQQKVQQSKDDVESMQVERNRWNDPAFIRAQARNRLYYVMPGEVSYLVMNEDGLNSSDTTGTVGALIAAKSNYGDISKNIAATKTDWMGSLVNTVVRAGVEKPVEKK